MGKDKLKRFAENLTFECFVQPEFEQMFRCDHPLKGHWHEQFFHNNNPIVLELGCGKGEYTVALAEREPDKNFIGVDIKGARMWRGAKSATEAKMSNVGFLRARIEFITSMFAKGEIAEIWITFPDPQLKTDSQHLFNYTAEVIRHFDLECEVANNDIYGSGFADEVLSVKTAYEKVYLQRGLPITYTRFSLGAKSHFEMFDWEGDDVLEKDAEQCRQ